jgi:DnaJ-class molecular chaperone
VKQIEVTLEDLYNGKEIEIDIERHRICSTCKGVGGTDPTAV